MGVGEVAAQMACRAATAAVVPAAGESRRQAGAGVTWPLSRRASWSGRHGTPNLKKSTLKSADTKSRRTLC